MFKKAFTLTELIIALALVAILAAVTIPLARNKMEKVDNYSYYLAYATVQDIAANIIAQSEFEYNADDLASTSILNSTMISNLKLAFKHIYASWEGINMNLPGGSNDTTEFHQYQTGGGTRNCTTNSQCWSYADCTQQKGGYCATGFGICVCPYKNDHLDENNSTEFKFSCKTHPELCGDPNPDPQPNTDPDPQPQPDPQPNPQPNPEPEPQPQPNPEPDIEPQPIQNPDPQPQPNPQPACSKVAPAHGSLNAETCTVSCDAGYLHKTNDTCVLPNSAENLCEQIRENYNISNSHCDITAAQMRTNIANGFKGKTSHIALSNGLSLFISSDLVKVNDLDDAVDKRDSVAYLVYVDVNGNDRGKGILYDDVFPFYLTISGKVIPVADPTGEGGANSVTNMNANILYDDYATGNRVVKVLATKLDYKTAACRTGFIQSNKYCGNITVDQTCNNPEVDCRFIINKPMKFFK